MKGHVLLGLLLALSLGARWGLAVPGDAKAGQTAYTKSCGACHAADGAPKEAIAKMLKVEMKNLVSKEVQAKSDAALRKEILEGTGKMKGVKGLNDKQVGDLIAFLRSLAKK